MPLVFVDERYADVHIAVLLVIVAWRIPPMQHRTLLESREVAELHLIGFEKVCIQPIAHVDQGDSQVYINHMGSRCMKSSAQYEANTANSVEEMAYLVSNTLAKLLEAHRQADQCATNPTNETSGSGLC